MKLLKTFFGLAVRGLALLRSNALHTSILPHHTYTRAYYLTTHTTILLSTDYEHTDKKKKLRTSILDTRLTLRDGAKVRPTLPLEPSAEEPATRAPPTAAPFAAWGESTGEEGGFLALDGVVLDEEEEEEEEPTEGESSSGRTTRRTIVTKSIEDLIFMLVPRYKT